MMKDILRKWRQLASLLLAMAIMLACAPLAGAEAWAASGNIANLKFNSGILTWSKYSGAVKYEIDVWDPTRYEWFTALYPEANETKADLNAAAAEAALSNGEYLVEIVAIGEANNPISNIASFSFEYTGSKGKHAAPANARWDGYTARWDAVSHAGEYDIQVFDSKDPSITVAENVLTGTSWNIKNSGFKAPLRKGRKYSFRVMARASNGYTDGDYAESSNTVKGYNSTSVRNMVVQNISDKVWTGSARTQSVKLQYGNVRLVKGRDYTVTYKNNKNIGKAFVTIKGKGDYSGSRTISFKILPKATNIKSLVKAKKAVTVKWKKQALKMPKTRITGYQIETALDNSFSTGRKLTTVKGYKKVSKKITNLQSGKKYYVRVRTYKTVSGKKYYSNWSKVKSVRTR